MTKTIVKLDNLSSTFDANRRFVTIGICGPTDQVRIAARDLIYGLGITARVDGKIDHVSEVQKMHGKPFEGDHAQINISFDVKQFERIVTLFRYCEQVGLPVISEGDLMMLDDGSDDYEWEKIDEDGRQHKFTNVKLGEYLMAAKLAADSNNDAITIENADKPFSHLLWTQAELAAHAVCQEKLHQTSKDMLVFFSKCNNMSPLERRKEAISIKTQKIITTAEDMLLSHPKNVFNYSQRILARDLLYQYISMKSEHPEIDPLTRYSDHFMFVRDDDREKFAALATKLDRLETELAEIKKIEQEVVEQFDSVMPCPIL